MDDEEHKNNIMHNEIIDLFRKKGISPILAFQIVTGVFLSFSKASDMEPEKFNWFLAELGKVYKENMWKEKEG